MVELHPLAALLTAELIVVLVLAVVFFLIGASKKRRTAHDQADDLVERIVNDEESHLTDLASGLSESGAILPESSRQQVVEAVSQQEKALYRHVIQAFLTGDAARLGDLDRYVRGISEPYCQLIQELIQRSRECDPAELVARIADLETQVQEARTESAQLREELSQSLATLDEVSKEYAKMFGDKHTAADLHASRLRMLDRFREAAGVGPENDEAITHTSREPRSS